MMYCNIIVFKNYDILHIISIIMRLCMIKHPGTHRLSARLQRTNGYQPNKKNGYHGIVTQQFIEGVNASTIYSRLVCLILNRIATASIHIDNVQMNLTVLVYGAQSVATYTGCVTRNHGGFDCLLGLCLSLIWQ